LKSIIVICAALMLAAPAFASDSFYVGTWKFTGTMVAPWADPKRKPDDALLGKTIVIAARQIGGPRPFACASPHYKVSDFTPDLLFQGALDEMRSNDKTVDPNRIAASLGFAGTAIKTLETGCEIDFYFVDATTAEIGLNDYVYTLKKQ
jgi:hypothetical protein